MDLGAFTTGLVTGLREAVEPALIVSIILTYLAKSGNSRQFDKIWIGIGAAVAFSVGASALLWVTMGGLDGAAEDLFEGMAMLAGASVVTWMIFWMRRTEAESIGQREPRLDSALVEGSIFGLAILAFTEIIGEGIDTTLFLLGQATAATRDAGALSAVGGAVVGIAIAIWIGAALYRGARSVDRRTFFVWAGIALVFIAAGLLSHAVREFVTAGWITVGLATVFDISAVLPHMAVEGSGIAGVVGSVLRAIFGYTSRPEWITFVTWLGYLAAVLTLYLRPLRPTRSESHPPQAPTPYGSKPPSRDLAKAASWGRSAPLEAASR